MDETDEYTEQYGPYACDDPHGQPQQRQLQLIDAPRTLPAQYIDAACTNFVDHACLRILSHPLPFRVVVSLGVTIAVEMPKLNFKIGTAIRPVSPEYDVVSNSCPLCDLHTMHKSLK